MRALIVAAFACSCGRIAFDVQGAPGDGPVGDIAKLDSASAIKLEFTSAAMALNAGACSQTTTVEAQDATGHPVPLPVATTLTLTSSSSATSFFLSPGCAGQGDVTIAAGASSATFYWSDTKKGSPMLEARATGYTGATQVETVRPLQGSQIGFETNPVTVTASTCSTALSVVVRDQYGNGSPVASDTIIMLGSTSATMMLYGNSGCAVSTINSVTITAGTSNSPMFYFLDSTIGSPVISATSAPLTAAMQTETVN